MRWFAKPVYGVIPVARVRIPPSPFDSLRSPRQAESLNRFDRAQGLTLLELCQAVTPVPNLEISRDRIGDQFDQAYLLR